MMDVGGSMDPYGQLVSQLFSAAKRATHWRELRTYYFHNCIYGKLFKTDGLNESIRVRDVIASSGKHYKLVIVGDACMASYELLGAPSWGGDDGMPGIAWLAVLREHFERAIWLNPDGPRGWNHPTVEAIRGVFPMHPLTLDGLGEAVTELVRGARTRIARS